MNTLVLKRAGLAGLAGLLLPSSRRGPWVLLGLGVALLASLIWSSGQGAFGLPLRELPAVLAAAFTTYWWPGAERSAAELVFFNIRLPRLVLAVAAGAGLGVAGALMQGLFRNPLADPGLIGVSSGAALAAAFAIVLGSLWWPEVPLALGTWPLMLMAFFGGLLVTALIYTLSLGDDVQRKELRLYLAFKRLKNFATVVLHRKNCLLLYLHVDPATALPVLPNARDVTNIGHWGTGNLEVTLSTQADLDAVKPFIVAAYEGRGVAGQ